MFKLFNRTREFAKRIRSDYKTNPKERLRLMVLLIGFMFFLDYLMFCFHSGKNPLEIFPNMPILTDHVESVVFLPSVEKKEIFSEKRFIPHFPEKEELIKCYIKLIARGSRIKNTRAMVPYKLYVRNIWFLNNGKVSNVNEENSHCIIDIETGMIPAKANIIADSESLFRDAVIKTIKTNIPTVKSVSIVVSGNPQSNLW